MNQVNFKQLQFSVLGTSSKLEGTFQFSGDTVINGQVKGEITIIDEGKVTLERESSLEGNIYCKDIDIFGKLTGSLHASGIVTIRPSATVSGNIKAKSLNIYPGATLNMEGHTQDNDSL